MQIWEYLAYEMVMLISRYPNLNIKKKILDKIFQKLKKWANLCKEQIF